MVGATDRYDGRSVALADLSNRGALDVIVANQRGPLLLYSNEVAPGRAWIEFDLEGGCRSDAAAARCTQPQRDRRPGDRVLERPAAGAGSLGRIGVLRAEPAAAALRPGRGATIEKAVVRWPSGKMQELSRPEPNRVHKIEEPA